MTAHVGFTESEFGASWWKAMCSCGFEGEPVTSEDEAVAELKKHYEQTQSAAP